MGKEGPTRSVGQALGPGTSMRPLPPPARVLPANRLVQSVCISVAVLRLRLERRVRHRGQTGWPIMCAWWRGTCEILAVASQTQLELGAVLAWAAELERFGISGFGWGVAWVDGDGDLHCYRKPTSLATDVQGMLELREAGCVAALVHLRRPSRLSTVEMADTQPFVDEARRFAFVHNGRFAWDDRYRPRFHPELLGRADSEVGFRLFASLLDEGQRPVPALAAV